MSDDYKDYWSLAECQKKIKELEARIEQLEKPQPSEFAKTVSSVFEQMNWVDEDGNPTTAEEIFKKRAEREAKGEK